MILATFKNGTIYTITHEYNGPGRKSVARHLNAAQAKAHAAFLLGLHSGNPMRTDTIIIDGSDGSQRHIYPA